MLYFEQQPQEIMTKEKKNMSIGFKFFFECQNFDWMQSLKTACFPNNGINKICDEKG